MFRTVVFSGPSLTDHDRQRHPRLQFEPPAEEGDILKTVQKGATRIGLIDGYFGDRRAVFHKEILWALANGVGVYGAASMGALRACEMHGFGMVGVGEIYDAYRRGDLTDDGAVAVLHGPAEIGCPALTIALVDVYATTRALRLRDRITLFEAERLDVAARALYFGDRTWCRVATGAMPDHPKRAAILATELEDAHVERKRLDALSLLRLLEEHHEAAVEHPTGYWPPLTPAFRRAMARAGVSADATELERRRSGR